MQIKKFIICSVIFSIAINIYSADYPIIFVYEHNSSGNTSASAKRGNISRLMRIKDIIRK